VVRERYWVTFQPGEIRVCASCHGTNDAAISPKNPIPQNEPEALRALLAAWKAENFPMHTSLRSPAKDTTGVPSVGTLTWQPTAKAIGYRVQLSATPTFDAPLLDRDSVSSTLQNFTGLAAGATYYWRVRGENPYGDGDWSEVWKFTTAGTTSGTSAPFLLSPVDGATGVAQQGRLTWNRVPGAMNYFVQISRKADFSTRVFEQEGVVDTTVGFSGLDTNTTYYWRVLASGPAGTSAWSQIWRFTTPGAKPSLVAPILISPPDGATKQALTGLLTWNQVAGATAYHVQVATANDFAAALVDRSDVSGGQLGLSNLASGTTYYWRVSALDAASGTGPWSPVWNFTTASPTAGVTRAATGGAVTTLRLDPNRPNPFSDATTLDFYLPRASRATLLLFDLTGRQVAGLVDADLEAGGHSFQLDMRRPELQGLHGGVYAVQLSANGQTVTRMIEVVR
jgi:hypothetical protein